MPAKTKRFYIWGKIYNLDFGHSEPFYERLKEKFKYCLRVFCILQPVLEIFSQ